MPKWAICIVAIYMLATTVWTFEILSRVDTLYHLWG
jgi:hypothetical protein